MLEGTELAKKKKKPLCFVFWKEQKMLVGNCDNLVGRSEIRDDDNLNMSS